MFISFLLIEREVCTEKYGTEVFFVETEPVQKDRGPIFLCTAYRASEVNKRFIIYAIDKHLYLKQTKNA
jgi:hypothetical protein